MAKKETKTLKRVCKCEHCGNEAEMVVTCTLVGEEEDAAPAEAKADPEKHHHRVKGTGTCSHCGNEADMWVDL
jgi:transcription elongation factor Elf1